MFKANCRLTETLKCCLATVITLQFTIREVGVVDVGLISRRSALSGSEICS